MQLADFLQSVSIILACLTIILGVDAWRREFIGKRKIELAEDVLTRFYEARDAIARIRSPFSTSREGGSARRVRMKEPRRQNFWIEPMLCSFATKRSKSCLIDSMPFDTK